MKEVAMGIRKRRSDRCGRPPLRSPGRPSVAGRGERLWRTIKYEEVYLRAYASVSEARASLGRYLAFYNAGRPHSSLDRQTPDEAYFNPLQPIPAAA